MKKTHVFMVILMVFFSGCVIEKTTTTSTFVTSTTSTTSTSSTTTTSSPQEKTCMDTDDGRDILVQGTISGSEGLWKFEFTDECSDNSTLIEYLCVENQPASEEIDCPAMTKCIEGICSVTTTSTSTTLIDYTTQTTIADAVCYQNEDCEIKKVTEFICKRVPRSPRNETNPPWADVVYKATYSPICRNPGTPYAACEYIRTETAWSSQCKDYEKCMEGCPVCVYEDVRVCPVEDQY